MHRRTAAAHLCREVPVVQQKQGVPRLGGVRYQLVTSLPGNHSDLVGELWLRATGPSARGPRPSHCVPRQQGPQAAQPLPLRGPGGGAPAVLLPPKPRGGPGGAGVTGSGAQDKHLQGRGQHSGTAAAQAWKNLLRCCAETLRATPRLGPEDVHTRGGGVCPKRALGPGGLHPGRAPLSAWGAAYHVSRAQVGVVAAQPRVGEGDTQVSNLGRKRGEGGRWESELGPRAPPPPTRGSHQPHPRPGSPTAWTVPPCSLAGAGREQPRFTEPDGAEAGLRLSHTVGGGTPGPRPRPSERPNPLGTSGYLGFSLW